MTDSASPVNSQWAAIIADVAQSPNKDILIETTDPQFDEQVCRATFAEPDPSDIRDGRGLQVRLSATIAETITSVDGVAEDSRMGLARSSHPRRSRLQRGKGTSAG
jgi:hypothetical protein